MKLFDFWYLYVIFFLEFENNVVFAKNFQFSGFRKNRKFSRKFSGTNIFSGFFGTENRLEQFFRKFSENWKFSGKIGKFSRKFSDTYFGFKKRKKLNRMVPDLSRLVQDRQRYGASIVVIDEKNSKYFELVNDDLWAPVSVVIHHNCEQLVNDDEWAPGGD